MEMSTYGNRLIFELLYGSLKCDKNYIILKTIIYYCVELNLKMNSSKCISHVNFDIKIK